MNAAEAKKLIVRALSPRLERLGFSKGPGLFWKRAVDARLQQRISIETSCPAPYDGLGLYPYVGVRLEPVQSVFDASFELQPRHGRNTLLLPLWELVPGRDPALGGSGGTWWAALRDDYTVEEGAADLAADIEAYGVPFLDRFTSAEDVLAGLDEGLAIARDDIALRPLLLADLGHASEAWDALRLAEAEVEVDSDANVSVRQVATFLPNVRKHLEDALGGEK